MAGPQASGVSGAAGHGEGLRSWRLCAAESGLSGGQHSRDSTVSHVESGPQGQRLSVQLSCPVMSP